MSEYINKDETVIILERLRDRCGNDDMAFALNWAADTVKSMSAADVEEVRHREYINDQDTRLSLYTAECSCCNAKAAMGLYCMWCGAKMDKEKEE